MVSQDSPEQPDAADATEVVHQPRRQRLRWLVMLLGAIGIVLAVNQQFLLNFFGFQPLGNAYLYYLIGIFLAIAFLVLPATSDDRPGLLWLNLILAALALISAGWLGFHGLDIINKGWEYDAPLMADVMATILILLVLEGVRRAGGMVLLCTALLFGTYPLYADYMPGFLWGTQYSRSGRSARMFWVSNPSSASRCRSWRNW